MSSLDIKPESNRPVRQSALRASSITTALALGSAIDDGDESEPEFKRPPLPPSTLGSNTDAPPKKRRGRPPGSTNKGAKASFFGSSKKPLGKAREGRRAGEACTWCRYRRQKCDERDNCSLCQKDKKGCVYLSKLPRHLRDALTKPISLDDWNDMKDDIEFIGAGADTLPTPPPSPAVSQKKKFVNEMKSEGTAPVPSYGRLSMDEDEDDAMSGGESDSESPSPATFDTSYPTPSPNRATHLALSPRSHPFSLLAEQSQRTDFLGTIDPQRIHDPFPIHPGGLAHNALDISSCASGSSSEGAHVTLGDVELDSFEWCAEEFRVGGEEGELVQTHVDEFTEAAKKSWSTMNEFTPYQTLV
ncbi:hypothetical protein L202_08274 [Cryptococcus amylolentus CBS 6039]|uniref:Zn(2)-C6 fungal-type domain-containing protein n=1 Tax=Cryptococcus amylolentus CBS 6039 TaxID=1295533 RepID=A0A1E3H977_9TREE|nr:hypothetical protein L202_08274 [Cryptococcus amylolentus CBS 6039]ODN72844.1 hypothetical protein L202_08274 [Cryptococcus amylolentus CBS 6039]